MTDTEIISLQEDAQAEGILTCILDMGELLLTSGAEVMRVEDTLQRLCTAYGFTRTDVFTITSSIVLTVQRADGRVFTQTRRITARDTNLQRVADVNQLSRQICTRPLPVQAFRTQIDGIREKKRYPAWVHILAYGVISACFSVFFGGTAFDGTAAALSGMALFCILRVCSKLKLNGIIESILASSLTAIVVVVLLRLGIGTHADKITIGNIMLLIPGIGITTSLRDLINGDTISGLLGICEAVVKAVAIAIGFALVLMTMGG